MPHYEAIYNAERLHDLPNLWVSCQGIRLESNIGFPFTTDICRALKDAGHPDGSIAFFEDGYAEPTHTFPSVFEIADRKAIVAKPVLTDAMYQALTQISTEWMRVSLRIRNLLLDRGLVTIEEAGPEITQAAREAMTAYQARLIEDADPHGFPDIASASPADMIKAAELIGLKINGHSVDRTLRLIEATIADRSVNDVQDMARRVGVSIRMGRGSDDDMKKRRIMANIVNAGKLAEAL